MQNPLPLDSASQLIMPGSSSFAISMDSYCDSNTVNKKNRTKSIGSINDIQAFVASHKAPDGTVLDFASIQKTVHCNIKNAKAKIATIPEETNSSYSQDMDMDTHELTLEHDSPIGCSESVRSFSSCESMISDHSSVESLAWDNQSVSQSDMDEIEPTAALEATEVGYPQGYDVKFQQALHDSLQVDLAHRMWKWFDSMFVEEDATSSELCGRNKGCYCGGNKCEWGVAQSSSGDPEYRGLCIDGESSLPGAAAGNPTRHPAPWFYTYTEYDPYQFPNLYRYE